MVNIFNNQSQFKDDQFPSISDQLEAILKQEKHPNRTINVIYIEVSAMTELNLKYRNKDGPTDVISFPLQDELEPEFLGEIYICPQVALEQAPEWDNSFDHEILRLAVHGLLHLLGYDHESQSDADIMLQKENLYMTLGGK